MRDKRGRFIKGSSGKPAWNKGKKRWWNSPTEFKKNHIPWNKGIKTGNNGIIGEKHPGFKGNNVSYSALHKYIRYHFGTPKKCEICNDIKAKKYEWANISGEYRRDISDWKRVCTKCHQKMDDVFNKRPKDMYKRMWETRRKYA